MKHFLLLGFILISSPLVFFPTTTTYFSQDDWVFLSHVYKRPWIDVFRYYPEAFYRPIGQQLFFKIGSALFGLNPFGYHTIGFLIHSMNIWLIWKVIARHSGASIRATRLQTPSAKADGGQVESPARLLLIFLYAFHPVHLIALNWLTQADIEIAAMFSLLTILLFKKNFILSGVTFVAAMLSHETAAMLPVIMMLKGPTLSSQGRTLRTSDGLKGQILRMQGLTFRSKWVVLFCIAAIVLLAKYLLNPFSFQSDYSLGFHPLQLFSTTKWYVLRVLFLPEGIRQLPEYVQILSVLSFASLVAMFRWRLVRALGMFVISLLPVLFLSQHAFSVYAVIPVMLMTIELSHRVEPIRLGRNRAILLALLLFVTSFSSSRAVIPTHWTTTRGEISRKLTEEFLKSIERSDLAARSDLMKRMDFPPASEFSFASMMGKQFEVLARDLTE